MKEIEGNQRCVVSKLTRISFEIAGIYIKDNCLDITECMACKGYNLNCKGYTTIEDDDEYLRALGEYLR